MRKISFTPFLRLPFSLFPVPFSLLLLPFSLFPFHFFLFPFPTSQYVLPFHSTRRPPRQVERKTM